MLVFAGKLKLNSQFNRTGAAWRSHFSYNRFATVAARAVRNSLNEKERSIAARRGETALRYTEYENGNPSGFKPVAEESK